MDTALPQKFPFIVDRNLAKANCIENQVCTFCDIVVLDSVHINLPHMQLQLGLKIMCSRLFDLIILSNYYINFRSIEN